MIDFSESTKYSKYSLVSGRLLSSVGIEGVLFWASVAALSSYL